MQLPCDYYTANDLSSLPGMPKTESAVIRRAKKANWQNRKRSGKGGGLEYHISALPAETRSALLDQMIENLPETVCQLPVHKPEAALVAAENLPAPAKLAGWQRNTMDARLQILALIDQLARTVSLNKAIDRVVAQAKNELLPMNIQALIPLANARSGKGEGKRTISRRTLFRWRELRTIGATALAPTESKIAEIPAWAVYFLKCWQKPSKPSIPDALNEMKLILPQGIDLPRYSQALRFKNKLSKTEREKGRRSAKEMRAILPYRKRDTSDLVPLEVVQCDGHSFKARIAHPVHGKPFHPEVCAVIDAATRVVIGWSAGLAESAQTVADALRHGIAVSPSNERGGIPAIFYTDPGSGNKAKVNADPVFGRYARLGITFKTGIVGNSQARGMVERLQKSLWIRAAKQFPTYTGKGMDGSVEHKTYKLLMSDVRGTTNTGTLPSWPQFLDACQQAVDLYNNTPHSALPKITDAGGNRRYMTPNEKWDAHLATGWLPDTVTQSELDDLFRPRVQVKAWRGMVRLFGNVYFNSDLKHHNGEQVFVEYEPQDAKFVYVRDMEERLICKAGFEANSSRIFPVSATEDANDKRAAARSKRLTDKLEEVELERRGFVETSSTMSSEDRLDATRQLQVEMQSNVIEIPQDDRGKYRHWQRLHEQAETGETLTEKDQRFYNAFQATDVFQMFREIEADLGDVAQA